MKAITLYLGLDVHKDSITIAIAQAGLKSEIRVFGTITHDLHALEKALTHPRQLMTYLGLVSVEHSKRSPPTSGQHLPLWQRPSEADIKVTRDLIRAGRLLKIDVLDHVIMGNPNRCSMRDLGWFYN